MSLFEKTQGDKTFKIKVTLKENVPEALAVPLPDGKFWYYDTIYLESFQAALKAVSKDPVIDKYHSFIIEEVE